MAQTSKLRCSNVKKTKVLDIFNSLIQHRCIMSQILETGKWNAVPELMRSGPCHQGSEALLVVLTPNPASPPTDPVPSARARLLSGSPLWSTGGTWKVRTHSFPWVPA